MLTSPTDPTRYKRHRYPNEIIAHAVWLSFRFPLSYRAVAELLAARGIQVSDETMRQWSLKFGQTYANQRRHRRPQTGDKWHLDESTEKSPHWSQDLGQSCPILLNFGPENGGCSPLDPHGDLIFG